MSIELEPGELSFQRPLTREVIQNLQITNIQRDPVAFKVKTTAPKQYCVRPNSGKIEPGETVTVQVLLQPMKEEPPAGARCRDKFLVQSVSITPEKERIGNIASIWSYVEKNERGTIQEKKIRVIYLDEPEGGYQYDQEVTPIDENTFANETAVSAISPPQSPPTSARELRPEPIVPKHRSSSNEDVHQKLAEATRTIEQLRQQLQDQEGLRQRKSGKATEVATPGTAQPAQVVTEGIPMQIVAALCLISFLLAFFFF